MALPLALTHLLMCGCFCDLALASTAHAPLTRARAIAARYVHAAPLFSDCLPPTAFAADDEANAPAAPAPLSRAPVPFGASVTDSAADADTASLPLFLILHPARAATARRCFMLYCECCAVASNWNAACQFAAAQQF